MHINIIIRIVIKASDYFTAKRIIYLTIPNSSFKDFLINIIDISFLTINVDKECNILFLIVKMHTKRSYIGFNYNSSSCKLEANILYIIVYLIIALRIIKCFNLIDTLNAFINKRLGLNVMANRVFGQNNLPAVREKQAVSQTRKWS